MDFDSPFIDEFMNMLSEVMLESILANVEEELVNDVLEQSFDEQGTTLEKTDKIINVSTQKFSTVLKKPAHDKECSVCFSDFEKDDMVSELECTHLFHTSCIVEWGKYNAICPICRKNIE